MAYLAEDALKAIGFKRLGRNVMLSEHACIYRPGMIEIGNNVRIDDFCIISGNVKLGSYIHISVYSALLGGVVGIELDDFTTFAHGVIAFVNSDDYSGVSMTNSTVPEEYKPGRVQLPIKIRRHAIIGAKSLVSPGVVIAEGTAVGAMSMVSKNTEAWSIYAGVPAKKIKPRHKDLLELERTLLSGNV